MKAANKGDTDAMRKIGNIYYYGEGINLSYSKAFQWYQISANKGNTGAMVDLGGFYEKGTGVEQDDIKALGWYRKAADSKNCSGMLNLAIAYQNGKLGLMKNYDKSRYWYSQTLICGDVAVNKEAKLLMKDLP